MFLHLQDVTTARFDRTIRASDPKVRMTALWSDVSKQMFRGHTRHASIRSGSGGVSIGGLCGQLATQDGCPDECQNGDSDQSG